MSTTGSDIIVQIGPTGGLDTSGYYSGSEKWSGSSGVSTSGFIIKKSSFYTIYGQMVIEKIGDFKYIASHSCHIPSPPSSINLVRGSGYKSLTGALRNVSITTPVDTFVLGTAAISYE
jgi:hypothetical protein